MKNTKNILTTVYNAVAGAVDRARFDGPFTGFINYVEGLPINYPANHPKAKQQQDNTPKH
ncbi:MAG: hypothetical protein K8R48_05735 [Alphaproteobacteria bacterium]|nr:hypothetical protein [Alphaproteobacteria bacterium]